MIHQILFISYFGSGKGRIRDALLILTLPILMSASASPEVYQPFDYGSLEPDTAVFLRQQEAALDLRLEIRDKLDYEIGQILVGIRARLGYGLFKSWLEAKYTKSRGTAYNKISVYEAFAHYPNFEKLPIEPAAARLLAKNSTPEAARNEALTLAEAGGLITRSTAFALKQKYTTPPPFTPSTPQAKSESQTTSVSPRKPTTLTASGSKKPEIVAIRSKQQITESVETTAVMTKGVATVNLASNNTNLSDTWWQLGKHLLFCGDPNAPDFLSRLSEIKLLFAFPPDRSWFPKIAADIRIVKAEHLLTVQNPTQIEQTLEADILRYSNLREIVVSCFLPSPDILSAINRFGRHGVIAEPNPKRYKAVIDDWKRTGINVERVS